MVNILGIANNCMTAIESHYQVNPYIFGALYFVTVPPFYFSLYKLIVSLRKKLTEKALFWAILLAFFTLVPFLYVAFFGKNLPLWFWIVLLLFAGLLINSVVKKIKKRV